MTYQIDFKKKVVEEVILQHNSTSKTANNYLIPLKTLENWITAYNKDSHCFDSENNKAFISLDTFNKNFSYDNLSETQLRTVLMKKDIEIARLKKGYLVKEGGTASKVFVTLSKMNTK